MKILVVTVEGYDPNTGHNSWVDSAFYTEEEAKQRCSDLEDEQEKNNEENPPRQGIPDDEFCYQEVDLEKKGE